MTSPKGNSVRLMWMLGLAITLPMILVSGPIAGYFIGYLLIRYLEWPSWISPLMMGLGLAGSGLQSYRLIQKLNQSGNQKTP